MLIRVCATIALGAVLSFASSWVCAWFGPFGRSTWTHWDWKRDPAHHLVWDTTGRPGSTMVVMAEANVYEYGIEILSELRTRPYPWWCLRPKTVWDQFESAGLWQLGIGAIRMEGFPVPCVAHLYHEVDDSHRWTIEVQRQQNDVYLPCLIVPWPFAANTAIWTGILGIGWWGIGGVVRRVRRREPDSCQKCGYSLVGIAAQVCPECGTVRNGCDAGEVSPAPPR
jgi:hypothetical protein